VSLGVAIDGNMSSDTSRVEEPTLKESALSTDGPLAEPRIRLMQRPKEAPVVRSDLPKTPTNGSNLWDDDEWDSNRQGDTSNRKLWETA
jgi:hypothetical protein